MYRRIVASSVIFSLLFSPSLIAAECQNPFAGTLSQFQLFEQLDCAKKTNPVVLQIAPVNGTMSRQNPYLSPRCDTDSPLFEIFNGAFVIDYTESVANAHSSKVHVLQTCDGARLFMIDREPLLLTLPSGQQVNTSLRVYAEDAQQTLLAYALVSENDDNHMTLRLATSELAAAASKSFKNQAGNCSATWTVSNIVGNQLTATIASFVLLLKDNTEFSCVPVPVPLACPGNSLSTGAAIGIGMAIGASLTTAVATAIFCARRHRPSMQKLLE